MDTKIGEADSLPQNDMLCIGGCNFLKFISEACKIHSDNTHLFILLVGFMLLSSINCLQWHCCVFQVLM